MDEHNAPKYITTIEAADKLAEAVIAERHARLEGHDSSVQMAREKIYDALNVYLDIRNTGK